MSLRILVLLTAPVLMTAQTPSADEALTRTVTALDAAVFDAYNTCDLAKFTSFFADDVEFYHDQSGLMTGVEKLKEGLQKNICGKVRREAMPATVKVYPMKGFGAVQTGSHRFTHPGNDDKQPVGEAKFIHLWQNKEGVWKITRVISYDHRSLPR
jgi:ketosteroid isomerase-like protein